MMSNYHREPGDDLNTKDTRLEYRWKWSRVASRVPEEEIKKWTHFQCSKATVGSWTLWSTQWNSGSDVNYEASIRYRDEHIARLGDFKTRLDAQIAAEKLLVDWINEQKELIS